MFDWFVSLGQCHPVVHHEQLSSWPGNRIFLTLKSKTHALRIFLSLCCCLCFYFLYLFFYYLFWWTEAEKPNWRQDAVVIIVHWFTPSQSSQLLLFLFPNEILCERHQFSVAVCGIVIRWRECEQCHTDMASIKVTSNTPAHLGNSRGKLESGNMNPPSTCAGGW